MDELIAIEEEEKIQNQDTDKRAQLEQLESLYTAAHVPGIDTFLKDWFDTDPDFQYVISEMSSIIDFIRKIYPIVLDSFDLFQEENMPKFRVCTFNFFKASLLFLGKDCFP